jgi:hypothetical protein
VLAVRGALSLVRTIE